MTTPPRYRILGPIGTGGMGAVFLGRRDDGSFVAIKKQHAHLADDSESIAMFVDEARLASKIRHPNVVGVVDVQMNGSDLVLVMEYVEGASLAALLRGANGSGGALPPAIAVRVLSEALRGLHAAHELRDRRGELLGVVHRDVSPQNLLVGLDGVTRVTDFGIAKATGRLVATRTGAGIRGKLIYLSPEQILQRTMDRRADVFAAGIVLWECLTGKSLFGGATEAETIGRVLGAPVAPPSAHAPDVSLELDEVCLRALERDSDRRFASAEEFANALAALPSANPSEVAELVEAAAGAAVAERRAWLSKTPSPFVDDVSMAAISAEAQAAPRAKRSFTVPAVTVAALAMGLVAGGLGVRVFATPDSAPASTAASVQGSTARSEPIATPIASSIAPEPSVDVPSSSTSSSAATPSRAEGSSISVPLPAPPDAGMSVLPPVVSTVSAARSSPSSSRPSRTRPRRPEAAAPFVPKEM